MKQFFIFLVVGIFFFFIARYIFTSPDFSPLNKDMVQSLIIEKNIGPDDAVKLDKEIESLVQRGLILSYLSANAYLLSFCLLTSIFCVFVSIHIFVDKLFFKNFYEKASFYNAIRRGFLFVLAIALVVYFRLYKVEPYVLALVPLAALVIEIMISRFGNGSKGSLRSDGKQEEGLNGEEL